MIIAPRPFIILSYFLALLLRLIHCSNEHLPPVTPINRDLYRSSDALMEEIEALVNRHKDRLHMETFQSSNKGYHAELNVVTYCRNRTAIDDKSKFRILLSFGQHARELITSELALRILSILSEEQFLPKVDPVLLNKTLEKIVIKVVPLENLNGRKKVEAGELCERRNGRGVDLNRNWSVDWGKKEKDFDPYEENPGTAPFSEPEAQLMRKLSMSFDPHIWVNVHSGMEALFMPYDHKNTTPSGLESQKMKLMLETLNHLHCGDRCVVGSGGGSVGYLAHGTTTDYMFDVARVPMSFTFEIYGDEKASSRDCFKMFNPVDHPTFNIFFPMVDRKHWNLFVFDTEKRQLQIWDTLKRIGVKEFEEHTKALCRIMASLTKNNAFMDYTPILVNVPKQNNGHDCGVYVCRSMEYPDEVMQFHEQTWISDEQRCLLAIRILTAPENIPFDNSQWRS